MKRLFSLILAALLSCLLTVEMTAQPTVQASNIAFSNVNTTSVRVLFERGNGAKRVVVVKQTTDPNSITNPPAGIPLTSDNSFGQGSDVGGGTFVVYDGTGRTVVVEDLTPGTPYTVEVFEYDGNYNYGAYPAGSNNPRMVYTVPVAPSNPTINNNTITKTSFEAQWTAPGTGDYEGYIVTVDDNNNYMSPLNWYNNLELGDASTSLLVEDVNAFPQVDITPNTTYYFRVRSFQNSRRSVWANYNVGVTTLPDEPVLSETAATICQNDVYTVVPTGPTPIGSGTNDFKFRVYTQAQGGNPVNVVPGTTVNLTPAVGVNNYWVATYSNKTGFESAERTALTITVNAPEVTADAGADQDVCGSLQTNLAGNATNQPGNGTWSYVSGPGSVTFNDPNNPTTQAQVNGYGTYVFKWTVTQAGCGSSEDEVTINYYQNPNNPNAGPDQYLCGTLEANLAGNQPQNADGKWSYAGPGQLSFIPDDEDPAATVQATVAGTYTLTWTFTSPCATPSDDMTIVFDDIVTPANAGSDQDICGLSTFLAGNAPQGTDEGTWTWSGPGNVVFNPDANTNNATVTVDTYGEYSFEWSMVSTELDDNNNPICPGNSDITKITFYEIAPIADAGLDQNICGTFAGTLQGNDPMNGDGYWTVISQPQNSNITFNDEFYEESQIVVDTYGDYVLQWNIDAPGPCPDSDDQVTITFTEDPTAPDAGPNTFECVNLNAQQYDFYLQGNTPAQGETGTWVVSNQPGGSNVNLEDANDPNTGVEVDTYGAYSFQWTISNVNCPGQTDQVDVVVIQGPPLANAGADDDVCTLTYQLNGNAPGGGNTGTWAKVSGPGNANFNNVNDENTTVTVTQAGDYVFKWTLDNNNCQTEDEVEIGFNTAVTASLSNDANNDEICDGESVTFTAGGGVTYEFFVNGNSVQGPGGSNTYVTSSLNNGDDVSVEVTGANNCTDTDLNTITVHALPNATLTSSDGDNTICEGESVTFTANGVPGQEPPAQPFNYEFFVNGNSVQGPNNSNTYVTTTLNDGDDVTVTVTNQEGCSETSSGITTTVNPNPVATLTNDDADNTICAGDQVTFTAGGGTTYEFFVNGNSEQGPNNTNTFVTSSLNDQDVVTVTVGDNGCEDTHAGITMTVNALPNPTLTSSDNDNTICEGDQVTFTAGGGTNYEFSVNGQVAQVLSGQNTYVTTTLQDQDEVTVRVVNANGCEETSNGITTTVNPIPTATLSSDAQNDEICDGSSVTFTAGGGSNYEFFKNGNSVQNGANDTYIDNNVADGDGYYVVVTDNGCSDQSQTITITVTQNPTPANAGPDQLNIQATQTQLAANNPAVGTGEWSIVAGDGNGSFQNDSDPTTTFNGTAGQTYTLRWTITNDPCPPSTDDVDIEFNPPVAPTHLAIQNIGTQASHEDFDITVYSTDLNGINQVNAQADIDFTVSIFAGNGTLVGTTTGTIAAGTATETVNVEYQNASGEEDVQLQATANGLTEIPSNQFDVVVQAPTVQANNIQFGSVNQNDITLFWDNGDGDGTFLIARLGSITNDEAQDGTDYASSTIFGNGDAVGANSFAIYEGSAGTVTVTGLTASRPYAFRLFEYNDDGSGNLRNYETSILPGSRRFQWTKAKLGGNEYPVVGGGAAISRITPNPASENASMEIYLAERSNVTVKLYASNGEEVLSIYNNESLNAGSHNIEMNIDKLVSGTYTVAISAGTDVFVDHLVIVK